ncbi:UNVERIFIED_CONTAM: hypothetical protein HDU68_006790 [Siphonaria sp. JEL0065]|nr:hypothetical protein HDU68_006790 [Siphonaria sp. JEL0065]
MGSLGAIVTCVLLKNVEIVVTGDAPTAFRQIFFCNHQTFLDWWFLGLYAWHQGSIEGLTIILMDVLKYVPFFGWLTWFAGFIFLKQKWAVDERKFKGALRTLSKRSRDPLLLIIFPEGLLVHPKNLNSAREYLEKQKVEAPPGTYIPRAPKHVILPRSKGLRTCIQELGTEGSTSGLDTFVDVTMGYWPSSRGFETGIYPHDSVGPLSVFGDGTSAVLTRVCLDFRVMTGPNSMMNLNQLSELDFDGWLKKRWELKDDLMEYFHEKGQFDGFVGCENLEGGAVSSSTVSVTRFKIVPKFMDFVRVLGAFVVLWGIIAGATLNGR